MRTFGLIGKNLTHSFSSSYFTQKFLTEGISNAEYLNFELNNIDEFPQLIKKYNLPKLNVTIPYKESVIPFLDELSEDAKNIGSVNTIQISNGKLVGYNTDIIGFKESIIPLLDGRDRALILGNGGAAKAVRFVFNQLNISYKTISRKSALDYSHITPELIGYHYIIVNTTPLGMDPKIKEFPKIPYNLLNKKHLLFDLIYNPAETLFLKYGKENQACTKNGLEMLQIQAEASWKIWNS